MAAVIDSFEAAAPPTPPDSATLRRWVDSVTVGPIRVLRLGMRTAHRKTLIQTGCPLSSLFR